VKEFFLPVAEPLGAIWLLLLASLGWLLWRRQWRSALWLAWPVLLIFVLGSTPLAESLVASAERPCLVASIAHYMVPREQVTSLQPSTLDSHYDAVVVLGGGYYWSEYDAYGFALQGAASRLVTGLDLFRAGKALHLVLGGCGPIAGETNLVLADRVMLWIGSLQRVYAGPSISSSLSSSPEERIRGEEPPQLADTLAPRPVFTPVFTLGLCRNTHDEAMAFRKLRDSNHWQTVLLVTSALHMPRSAALFKKQGLDVVPVACDFQACGVLGSAFSPFPRQGRFNLLGLYLHEKIGLVIYKLRGWI
jgi:uncharacterized SAM-binding protein YcdF (DUF218 family)